MVPLLKAHRVETQQSSFGRIGKRKNQERNGILEYASVEANRRSHPIESKQRESALVEEESSSEDSDDPGPRGGSYNVLLQSIKLSTAIEPSRKKQKVRHLNEPAILNSHKVDKQAISAEHDGLLEQQEAVERNTEEKLQHETMDDEALVDPFEIHFGNVDENLLATRLKAAENDQWKTDTILSSAVGKVIVTWPGTDSLDASFFRRSLTSPKDLKLKSRLLEPALQTVPNFEPVQSALCPAIFNYFDLLFGGRTVQNAEGLRNITCLHALNHVFKTRDRIIKNTAKLGNEPENADLDLRDQGFTRPKVLILLETRQSCVRYMDAITALCDPEQQENKKRFQDAFAQSEDNVSDDKPPDFKELFGGNDDNEFRLGVKFTRKTLKYYSQFYASDIILASPLGLRRTIKPSDSKKANGKPVEDYDFLSSIELLIIDQADAMLQQNWEHVEFALSHLNLQPKATHGCDFSRVRQWSLNGNAQHLRQTIVFSAYITPELNSLFSTHAHNLAGKVKTQTPHPGVLLTSGLPIRQTFSRFDSPSPTTDPDARFKYFTTAILPSLARHQPPTSPSGTSHPLGILIFIPSYLDFVRLRNHFSSPSTTTSSHLSFGAISEYEPPAAVRRARSHFLTGRHSILLYTGRAHHFHRYRIKGVRKVVLYGLPDNPVFYSELVGGFLGATAAQGTGEVDVDAGELAVRAMFSRWDGLALERIVGTGRAGKMVREGGGGDTFEFR